MTRVPRNADPAPMDLSVCIPTYNGAAFLLETLRSVEAQDFSERLEIILSDDGSTDDTMAILETFSATSRFPCRILRNENRGIGRNWNNCIRQAQGRYVKLLMQDDLLYSDHLSRLVEGFRNYPGIGLAFARRDMIDDEGRKIAGIESHRDLHLSWRRPLAEGPVSGHSLLADRNFLDLPRNKIGEPSSVLLSREAILATGDFSTDLVQALDYDYWYRVMVQYDVYFVDAALSAFRIHAQQTTARNAAEGYNKGARETILLFRSYIAHGLARHLSMRNRYRLYRRVWGDRIKTLLWARRAPAD